jgi:hypothetical protein
MGPARLKDQEGEERATATRGELDVPRPVQDLGRSQDAELHQASSGGRVRREQVAIVAWKRCL